MKRPPIRILDVAGTPEEMGATHGGVDAHSPTLAAEMRAMADAAGISAAEAIIVGGFTDFVDTVRAAVGGRHPATVIEDDCTAVIVPDGRAGGAGFLAQTWDMHDTATEHVILLRTAPADDPAALVFTTTGALGQLGMNALGVCVGINNLTATDGVPGVIWTQVVRDALRAETAVEGNRADELQESSRRRFAVATNFLDRTDVETADLMELTREPTAVCQVAHDPYHIESAGGAVMRPRTKEFWAVWGRPAENDYEKIDFVTSG